MPTDEIAPQTAPVLSVTELNRMARRVLEAQLPLLWVEGEISNFVRAASGHWYFTLKDATAQVRCTMFRGRNQFVDFVPANGDRVEVRGLPGLYEARGDFQLGAEALRRAGAGRLYEAFLKLKAELAAAGLFDAERKRALPGFPRRVGVVTSLGAAALRDVLAALARRMPGLPVVIYPTPVQGVEAPARIAAAIAAASARGDCDVLIVCRGGGSLEDLWAFNEAVVVRAVAACAIPVVSGVGHETDVTLTDWAADVRAPTPTAAAELVSPQRSSLAAACAQQAARLQRVMTHGLQARAQQLDLLARRLVHPAEGLRRNAQALAQLQQRLRRAQQQGLQWRQLRLAALTLRLPHPAAALQRATHHLTALAARAAQAQTHQLARRQAQLTGYAQVLGSLDPTRVLQRGFSLVRTRDGRIVRDAARLQPGDDVFVRFAVGTAEAVVAAVAPTDGAGVDGSS